MNKRAIDNSGTTHDEAGRNGEVISSRDITELKQAEELRRSEERFRLLVEGVKDYAIFMLDPEGHITSWNAGAQRIKGYKSEEILGRHFSCFYTEEDIERAHPENELRLAQEQGRYEEEGLRVRKDGSGFWASVLITALRDSEGKLRGFSKVVRDITERKRAEEALRESEERYRTLVERIPAITYIEALDSGEKVEHHLLYVSPQVENILGHPPQEWRANPDLWEELLHPDDRERVLTEDARTEKTGEPFKVEYRIFAKDNSLVWIRDEAVLIRDEEGRPLFWQGVQIDVTEQKQAEEALRSSEEFFRALYEDVCYPIFLLDRDLNFVDVNPYACKFYGYSRDEFIRMKVQDITPPEERDSQLRFAEKIREQSSIFIAERRHRKKNGEVVTVTADAAKVTRSGQELYVAKITDITERKALEERLEHLAYHDPLTDLPNRTLLMDCLEQALTRAQREGGEVATLLVDLDDLKVINDSLGHETGDRLLVSVGRRLRALFRPQDTVARFGGDEFVVVLEDTEAEEAGRVAQRLVEGMRTFFAVEGRELTITCSVGIALGSGGASGAERPTDLLRRADMALYEAKAKGKNRYGVFKEAMEAHALERLKTEHSLRQTIEREEGFVVHYQPVVSLEEGGRIVGFEALVRWNHPWRGLLLPAEFIPLAEQTGVIVGLGHWVLKEACRQAEEWHEHHPSEQPLTLSVNLSASQLSDPGLVEDVAGVLRSCGLEPGNLILEVTECALMGDVEASVAVLRHLKELGVQIAVDDFGKGYSSLSYLKRLPVDILKIDRSFVAGLGTDEKDEGIVRAVIDLARTLGLGVVAEGVESGEQLAHLRKVGCDLAQGFYFWHPLPAERADELLAAYNYP